MFQLLPLLAALVIFPCFSLTIDCTTPISSTYLLYDDCASKCLGCAEDRLSFAHNCELTTTCCETNNAKALLSPNFGCVKQNCSESVAQSSFERFLRDCANNGQKLDSSLTPMGYTYKDSDSNNTTKHTSAPVAAIVTPSVVVSLAIVILVCYLCWRHKRKCKYTGVAGDAESSSNAESSSKTAFGIKLLHDVEDAVVDIIFIHGLGGHRERTWRANGASNPWPQTLLPSKVPNARILTFGYGADVADWVRMVSANSLGNHAMNLLTAIATYREEDKTNNRPIIFVCHSLGGLLCEDALSRQRPDKHIKRISECTRAVAFLGTPHHGSDLAKWAETLAKTIGVFKRVNTKLLAVLKRDSEVLARVQDSFHTMIMSRRQDGLPPIAITCFFEQVPLSNVGLVVPSHSAILPGYMPIGIHKNHSDMTKFRGLDDDDFKAVAGEIRRWVKELEEEGDFGPL